MRISLRTVLAGCFVLFLNSAAWSGELQTIYVARHGETRTNVQHLLIAQKLHPDAVLSIEGANQAQDLADLLKGVELKRIYVSRLRRSQQTAIPLSKATGLKPVVRSQLDEMNFGSVEGESIQSAKMKALLARLDIDCDFRPGGGETRNEVLNRLAQFWAEIRRSGSPDRILAIAHYSVVQGLLMHSLKLGCEEAGHIRPKNYWVFRLKIERASGRVLELARSEHGKPFRVLTNAELTKGRTR